MSSKDERDAERQRKREEEAWDRYQEAQAANKRRQQEVMRELERQMREDEDK